VIEKIPKISALIAICHCAHASNCVAQTARCKENLGQTEPANVDRLTFSFGRFRSIDGPSLTAENDRMLRLQEHAEKEQKTPRAIC
jgi:hypothetical protein